MKKKKYRKERKNRERRFEETDSGTESEVDEKKNPSSSEHMLFDELMMADTNNFYHL